MRAMDTGPPTLLPDTVCSASQLSLEWTSGAVLPAGGLCWVGASSPKLGSQAYLLHSEKQPFRATAHLVRRAPGDQEGYLGCSGGRKKERNSPTVD